MGIRIWYQTFLVGDDVPDYMKVVRGQIRKAVRQDTEVVMHGFVPGSFRGAYPGPEISSNFLFNLHSVQFVLAALEAEKQGYDVMMLSPLSAPMICEARSLIDIPVTGYGDATFRFAGMYGRRFGVVFFNLGRAEFWPQRMAEWGLTDSFAGLIPAGVTFAEVQQVFSDRSTMQGVVGRVIASCERMVKEHAVDVIVPGEMVLNVLLAEAGISRIADAPVLDGMAITLKMAEMMVDLKRANGLYQSRRGYFHASPGEQRVKDALKLYGLDRLEGKFPEIR